MIISTPHSLIHQWGWFIFRLIIDAYILSPGCRWKISHNSVKWFDFFVLYNRSFSCSSTACAASPISSGWSNSATTSTPSSTRFCVYRVYYWFSFLVLPGFYWDWTRFVKVPKGIDAVWMFFMDLRRVEISFRMGVDGTGFYRVFFVLTRCWSASPTSLSATRTSSSAAPNGSSSLHSPTGLFLFYRLLPGFELNQIPQLLDHFL